MNEIAWRGRTYRIGRDDTPIIKFIPNLKDAYILKPEGLFLMTYEKQLVELLFMLRETDREKMIGVKDK
jgi:hypothetical protein